MSEADRNQRQRQRLSVQAVMKIEPDGSHRIFAVMVPSSGSKNVLAKQVLVQRGQLGWFEVPKSVDWQALRNAQSDAETDAALAGSMFGWHTPAAKAAML